MQLASQGTRAVTRNVANINPFSQISQNAARSFHTPSIARKPVVTQGTAQKLVSKSRVIFSRFFAHLTAPGLGSAPPSVARTLHGGASGQFPTINQRMSLPVRTKLARPLQPRFFPRGPSVPPPCSVTNIGLGTARNFSTGRSVFQNLVENVPIAGRAFYEADWEIKGIKEREMLKKSMRGNRNVSGSKQRMKPKAKRTVLPSVSQQTSSPEVEIEKYFPSTAVSPVTTRLLIPLAPTPTSRVPLPPDPDEHQSLLPLPHLAFMHNSHELHSLRVSSLFSRLDAANVWERGVVCSAYAQSAAIEGVCTILKVEFNGWTKDEVRSVIGESGSGWCILEETSTYTEPDSDTLSDTSSVLSEMSEESMETGFTPDAAVASFVLPTLDFSSTFLGNSASTSSQWCPSDTDMFSESDSWSDVASDSSEGPPATDGWMGFSSDFVRRSHLGDSNEPREMVF